MSAIVYANRLARETSPYLLQHAHNPVDWYPWGEEALERARREDKPILLSIGYSACHWCHVMEHESFEDEAVARVMNEHFINIKVDREERPDLDRIYQTAHQLLVQRPGGWPLTVFLTPDDLMPFFAGTYFPKTPRHGLPGFVEVLEAIARAWREHRRDIEQQNAELRSSFARLEPAAATAGGTLSSAILERAIVELKRQYDWRHGGFGNAPKFPQPASLALLLRHYARTGELESLAMLRHALVAMARGGIYDQIGGGFCRYSVDEAWRIPHFEKMLYDNAQLLALYAEVHALSGDALLRRIALETAEWVMREMQSPEGGYYASLDADSEGHEGKFYVWTAEEIRAALSEEAWRVVEAVYALEGEPNFEGKYHLNVHREPTEVAKTLGRAEVEIESLRDQARMKLFAVRSQRVPPRRDEKILTAWNGLMIKGMARAGRLLGRDGLVASAARALDFIRTRLWRDGRLLATYKDGRARLNAYLDDHVFLLDGVLELLQARFCNDDLAFARALAELVLSHFEDPKGGFYFTSNDHERLILRPKPLSDEAVPSGNGVAALTLARLGHLLGEVRYLGAAERTLQAAQGALAQFPSAHATLAIALEEFLFPPQIMILRGAGRALATWQERCRARYHPKRLLLTIENDVRDLTDALAAYVPQGEAVAYVCSKNACSPPVTSLEALEAALAAQ